MSKTFQKKIEDFVCENCGRKVKGSGYTNHCPNCLWSRHVDINPGDRKQSCKGMMKPIGIEKKAQSLYIVHLCIKCGFTSKNKCTDDDSIDKIIEII